MRFRSWSATHAGAVRKHNEDRVVDRPQAGLWAVADGAGGHELGELASGWLAEALEAMPVGLSGGELLAQVRLRVADTHAALCAEATRRGPHVLIASTVVVLIARDAHFACLWAGDSRCYLLRDGELRQITRDHSLVQELVDSGMIDADAAERHPQANVITRAVGAGEEALVLDKVSGALAAGDRFLLCSDGLSKTLSDAELAALLSAPDRGPPPEALIAAALARGATDNVSAVVVEVGLTPPSTR